MAKTEEQETEKRTCTRCGKKFRDALPSEDCIAGKEIEGAGTEPHTWSTPKVNNP